MPGSKMASVCIGELKDRILAEKVLVVTGNFKCSSYSTKNFLKFVRLQNLLALTQVAVVMVTTMQPKLHVRTGARRVPQHGAVVVQNH